VSDLSSLRYDHHVRRPRGVRWPGLVVVALALALPACADSGPEAAAEGGGDVDLAGRVFVSTEVNGHDLVPGTQVQLTFADEGISAIAGCNTLSSGATWDTGELVVSEPMAQTMMACPDEVQLQDAWLHTFLISKPALSLNGTTLTLGDSTEGIVLTEQSA
jgi:heat shock protein HslJ